MENDFELAELMRLSALAKITPGRPSVVTMHRWASIAEGPRLRTVCVGGVRMSSERWLKDFFVARSKYRDGDGWPETLPTCRRRERAIEAAERRLEREGL